MQLLLSPSWIAPVIPKETLLTDHSLLIEDGKIKALLPRDEAHKCYPNVAEKKLPHHLIIPGLVNAHAHSPMTLLRTLGEDQIFETWLHEHILPAEAALLSPEFVSDGTTLAISEMLLSGTTTFSEHYFFPEQSIEAIDAYGMRACVGLWVGQHQGPWCQNEQESLALGLALHQNHCKHPRISLSWAPHSPYLTSEQALRTLNAHALEHGLPIHIHCQETLVENQNSIQQHGMKPWQRLQHFGMDHDQINLVHMVATDDQDLKTLQNAHVISCPISNLKLGSGIAPIPKMLKRGTNVALGTDSAASNNSLDMMQEMRTLALIHKGIGHDASMMSAPQVLECATLGGAKALGLEAHIGSLCPGKAADLVAIDLDHPRTYPHHDPISQLIHAALSSQITHVWIDGEEKVSQGVLSHKTLRNHHEIVEKWGARTQAFFK